MAKLSQNDIMTLLDSLYDQVIVGIPYVSKPISVLATDYTTKYSRTETAAKKMISNQVKKCTVTGVLTGLGGAITLPVAVSADIGSVLYVQMRMIACTANMAGYDLKDDAVQTLVYACLAGVAIDNVIKDTGIKVGEKLAVAMIKKIPGEVITKINQKVGFRLLTKFGEKGVVNLGKAVPVVGGFIGGGLDYAETKVIGNRAYKFFIKGDTSVMQEKKLNRVAYSVTSDDFANKAWFILNLSNELEIENHYYMKDAHMHFVDVVCNDSELKKLRKKLSEDGEYSIRKLTSGEYKFMCGCPSWESADEI